jgi:large conductance mechanosensitive channel
MSFISEFKAFVSRGNVVDLAVGVIIGGAFGKIISSLVNDVLMPPLGLALGGVNFTELTIRLKEAVGEAAAVEIKYGVFLQTLIDFLIIALVIFWVLKAYNRMTAKPAVVPEPEAISEPSAEEKLLTEIRDLLRQQRS